jgi:hypothetical protein
LSTRTTHVQIHRNTKNTSQSTKNKKLSLALRWLKPHVHYLTQQTANIFVSSLQQIKRQLRNRDPPVSVHSAKKTLTLTVRANNIHRDPQNLTALQLELPPHNPRHLKTLPLLQNRPKTNRPRQRQNKHPSIQDEAHPKKTYPAFHRRKKPQPEPKTNPKPKNQPKTNPTK